MTQGTKTNNFPKDCASQGTDFMASLRKNISQYIRSHDLTADELAELADVSPHTMHSILYKKASDCKVSTAIKIALAMEISIDELFHAGTINEITLESIQMTRHLPENQVYLTRWFIRHQYNQCRERESGQKIISVMRPPYKNGHLRQSNDFEPFDISRFPDDIKAKCFIGIQITCPDYMPYYSPYDTLLLASDREPRKNEHCVIIYFGRVIIATRQRTPNGTYEYIRIRDHTSKMPEKEIEFVGYVAGVSHTPR